MTFARIIAFFASLIDGSKPNFAPSFVLLISVIPFFGLAGWAVYHKWDSASFWVAWSTSFCALVAIHIQQGGGRQP